jgi:two-component system, NarL family, nitrate/nitrite response regulator NarL
MIRVVIISDIRLYQEGLALILAQHEGIAVTGAAACEDAILGPQPPGTDVVLVDTGSSNGSATVRSLVSAFPEAKVVALAVPDSEQGVLAYAEAGAAGFVTRDSSIDELVATIRGVACGELVCSPRNAAILLRRVSALAAMEMPRYEGRLTVREREIAGLIDAGLSNKQIASRLHIELSTVKNHVHSILEKTGAEDRQAAARHMRSTAAS